MLSNDLCLLRFRERGFSLLARVAMLWGRLLYSNAHSWPFMSQSSFRELARKANIALQIDGQNENSFRGVCYVKTPGVQALIDQNQENRISVLISGDSDMPVLCSQELGSRVINWFGQNLMCHNHIRHRLIPIGLEDRRFGRMGYKWIYRLPQRKKIKKLLVPPMSPTNPLRTSFLKIALVNPLDLSDLIEFGDRYLNWISYFLLVRRYQFVLCLEGNGLDTHRVWETLYLNSFPVMIKNDFSQELKNLGFPIFLIDSLEDFNFCSMSDFLDNHKDFSCRSIPQLWMNYWFDQIINISLAQE